jgi:hypothetical protein
VVVRVANCVVAKEAKKKDKEKARKVEREGKAGPEEAAPRVRGRRGRGGRKRR